MGSSADRSEQGHARSRWGALAGLFVLVLVGVLATVDRGPAESLPAEAPPSVFSAARAAEHVERIAEKPRPVGSAHHAETRRYLLDRLDSWGWTIEVRRGVGADPSSTGTRQLAAVSNIVARMPGTDPSGTVVLAAHYDSVPGSPGAADDGLGLGVLLETARALSTDGYAPRNDVMLLITDAEELGLLGAEAFVREHTEELGTTVLLNHEARGNAGTPSTFRTTSPNGELLRVLSAAPEPVANSAFEAAFEALPNDTDVTRFAEGGLHSYDTAVIGGGAYYHTPLDTPDRLSRSALQQMGQASLAITRQLAVTDLTAVPGSGRELVITTPWGLLRWPAALEEPLAWMALALVGLVTALRHRRGDLTLPRVGMSVGVTVAVMAMAGTVALAVWRTALAIDPGQASVEVGTVYRPEPYRLAMASAGLGLLLVCYLLARRRIGTPALATGGLVTFALCGVVAARTVPGASALLLPPLLPAVLGHLLTALLPRRHDTARTVILVLALVPAALVLGPNALSAFAVGAGMGGVLAVVFLSLFVWLALPLFGLPPSPDSRRVRVRRHALVPALGIVLVAALTATGLVANRSEATPPRQEHVLYALNTATGRAHWASPRKPDTGWSRARLTEQPAVLDDSFPWLDGRKLFHGPAPAMDESAPRLDVIEDRRGEDGRRELLLRLSSPRGATGVGMWIANEQATVRAATVGGRDLSVAPADDEFGFLIDGTPPQGVEVRLVLDQHHDALTVRVADRGHDLGSVPGFTPPEEVLVTPTVAVAGVRTL
ncbi:M28 family peptidase [Actinopolyspora mortivallis]|uniref:Peptidase M28 n=1 Tax=Actinopolyspora mortivallis TaxID=33906 RepID=A0A2T0GVD4_ACTMO|nr:M28 family peptidase [Actinopolyspora mortivallis]PRW63071.1 peptidase M28 [Actinopolyspora mortivallis]